MRAIDRPVQQSFDDLGTPLHEVTFCVLDLETTGGDRTVDEITEIGVVKVRGGEVLGTFQTLVNPGRSIPPAVALLTGLTDALVAPAPRLSAVLPSLWEFLGDAVIVGHNVGFDLAFLQRAAATSRPTPFRPRRVDTVALARRLVRDEVPDCRLSTLASRLRLDHQPSHRALDDALATTDLLHLLLERASGLGVYGLDDLTTLASMAGHAQAAKLRLTADLPRSPGVYLFCGRRDEVLYVGKATNLRARVRSYFGREDRRRIGAMLREAVSIRHYVLPDPLSAEVVELRLIARLLPRYNRAGTRADKYCYLRLDTDSPWPRLSVVREPARTGLHLGPLPSRRMAALVVEAIQSVTALRRCSTRLTASYRPPDGLAPCAAAQLGVAACPCAGVGDEASYRRDVQAVVAAWTTGDDELTRRLTTRMQQLAVTQRYEEAALTRDRMSALDGAVRRTRLMGDLVRRGRFEVRRGDHTWIVDHGRLIDVRLAGSAAGAIPVAPPEPASVDRPLSRLIADEALLLAKHLDVRS